MSTASFLPLQTRQVFLMILCKVIWSRSRSWEIKPEKAWFSQMPNGNLWLAHLLVHLLDQGEVWSHICEDQGQFLAVIVCAHSTDGGTVITPTLHSSVLNTTAAAWGYSGANQFAPVTLHAIFILLTAAFNIGCPNAVYSLFFFD